MFIMAEENPDFQYALRDLDRELEVNIPIHDVTGFHALTQGLFELSRMAISLRKGKPCALP